MPGFAEGTQLNATARTSGHDVVQPTDVEHFFADDGVRTALLTGE